MRARFLDLGISDLQFLFEIRDLVDVGLQTLNVQIIAMDLFLHRGKILLQQVEGLTRFPPRTL